MSDERSHSFSGQKKVNVGETAVFKCNAFGKVRWIFNGGSLPTNALDMISAGNSSHTLAVWNVTSENAGIYTCMGEDIPFRKEVVLSVSCNH